MQIDKLAKQFYDKMEELQYKVKYLKQVSAILSKIVAYHHSFNKTTVDYVIMEECIQAREKYFAKDKLAKYHIKLEQLTAWRLLTFAQTGKFETKPFTFPKTFLTPYFDEVIEKYVQAVGKNEQQRKSRAWAPKRFAKWLLNHEMNDYSQVTVYDIRQFILDEVDSLSSTTVPTFRSEMRRFTKWLFENDYTINSFGELFDFHLAIDRKVHPAALPDDVAKVLNAIDRTINEGKRSYAILMLSVVLGLRGTDIAQLKFSDIDWITGEIRITQSKTGFPLALPLTQDVGEALSDYILNARPKANFNEVFLTLLPPIRPLSNGRSPNGLFNRYCRKAGVATSGIQSLRRAVGKNLVVSGVPVTTVAQVLGHSTIHNTKQYIALDTIHLKECALSFNGFEPRGWGHE